MVRYMDKDYEKIVSKILNNKEFLKRKEFQHHGEITVYDHSLSVSKLAYKMAKKLHIKNLSDIAIGGLLHDFYYNPWQDSKIKKPLFKKHGFVHAREALDNSRKYFPELINDRVADIILRHMFPLNITPPKYKEAWLVSIADKIISTEALLQPKFIKSMMGIGRKK